MQNFRTAVKVDGSEAQKRKMYNSRVISPWQIGFQQYIVNIYTAYLLRKEIDEQLKVQVKNVCPILIKGSLEEAENG